MSECQHKKVMAVPLEDDPDQLAMICLQCETVLYTYGPDDPELEAEGDSLGDPEGDEWDGAWWAQ